MPRLVTFLVALASLAAAQQPPAAPADTAQFRITGTVVNASGGERLPQTRVQIAPITNLEALQTFITGEDGKFLFEELQPGKYALNASRRGFREQSYDQHGYFSTAIAVGPNLDSENIVFRLIPDAEISGRIAEDGDPVTNGQVTLFHHAKEAGLQFTHVVESAQVDDQGNYHFGHLLPGTYFVAVSAEPWYAQHQFTPVPQPTDGTPFTFRAGGIQSLPADPKLDVVFPPTFYESAAEFSAATPITIHPGEKYQADISLHAVPALRLRVHMKVDDPNLSPSVYATQSLFGAPQFSRSTAQRIGNDWEVIGVSPGHVTLNVETQGVSRVEDLDISGNTEIDLSEKSPATPLTGTITFQGSATVPLNVWLTLSNRGSERNLGAPVASDGSFSLRQHVPPGAYEVYVNNGGAYIPERISASGARVVGQTIEIRAAANEPVRLSIVMSRQSSRLDGTAYLEDKPFAGAIIVLVPPDPSHNPSLFRLDQSDSDGTFTLSGILPGKYTLIALRDAWDMDWSSPAVLSQYMTAGRQVDVAANGKYKVKIDVQSAR